LDVPLYHRRWAVAHAPERGFDLRGLAGTVESSLAEKLMAL
jgi:hypothetical protein